MLPAPEIPNPPKELKITPYEQLPLITIQKEELLSRKPAGNPLNPGRNDNSVYLFPEMIPPLAVKLYRELNPEKRLNRETDRAQIFEQLGIGPKVYGRVEISNGKKGYAMGLAEGKTRDSCPNGWINDTTIRGILQARDIAIRAGYVIRDIQYLINPTGKITFIDPELIIPIEEERKNVKRRNLYTKDPVETFRDEIDNEINILRKRKEGTIIA